MRPKNILAPQSYDRATRGTGKDFADKEEADSAGPHSIRNNGRQRLF